MLFPIIFFENEDFINIFAFGNLKLNDKVNMNRVIMLLCAILLCCPITVVAQEPIFRNYTVQQYRGQTQNWDVIQLPDGRMAFANNGGMMIYDGDQWSILPIRNYTAVRALCYDDSKNCIYAGATAEFGYYKSDTNTGNIVYHSLSDKLSASDRQFGEIWNICICITGDNRRQVVFQSKSHIFIYSGNGKIAVLKGLGRIEAMGMYNNKVVVATRNSMYVLGHGKLLPLPGANFGGQAIVRCIAEYHGGLLVATQQKGVFFYDGKQMRPFDSVLQPLLVEAQPFSMCVKGDVVAIGTVRRGLYIKNGKTNTVQNLSVANGLQDNTVLALYVAKSGNVWMALDNGLSCAVTSVPFRNLVSRQYNIGTGYKALANGQNIFLGTNQGLYLYKFSPVSSVSLPVPIPVNGILSQVWNLSDVMGMVLCCSDRGLFVVNGNGSRQVEGVDGAWNVLSLANRPGYMVVTDYLGACLLRNVGGQLSFVCRLKVAVPTSGNVYEDCDGNIWMSNWLQGIYRMRLSEDLKSLDIVQTFNAGNGLVVNENNILCRINGRIYVSSVDGLYYYDRMKKTLVYDKTLSKVFDTYGTSLKLMQISNGDIWAQKPGYLAVAHKRGNRYYVDSVSYRMLNADMKIGIGDLSQLDARSTIVNGNTGFFVASNNVKHTPSSYALLIRRITSTNDGDSVLYQSSLSGRSAASVDIPHSRNSIRIEFVQPEYRSDNAVTYQCRLINYDKQWMDATSTSKEYTKLAKGDYVFRVRSKNQLDGTVKETMIEIHVLPAWYETGWAYIMYVLLMMFAIYILFKWLKKRTERQLYNERVENERLLREQQTSLEVERTKRRVQMAEAKNSQLQMELKHKASELATSTMNLIQHNEMLQQLDEDVCDLSEAVRREDRKASLVQKVQNIREVLQSYLNDDRGWEQFEENFNVVYDDFMMNLTREFPNLKKADRKLCAYLKMGLSSKEMASLLNMPLRSVETARYRLRKKLNLGQGDNLSNFIQGFGVRKFNIELQFLVQA